VLEVGPLLEDMKGYFSTLEQSFSEQMELAQKSRLKGLDPSLRPESVVTVDLAERVEKSVGPGGVAVRIRELSNIMPREELAFKIAEEIVYGKYDQEGLSAADQAIRSALAILGEGVTVAPIEGISSIREKTNPDRSKYLAIYFAGPIRSAGGTEMGLTVVVADFARTLLGFDRYKATEVEAKRFVAELRIYEREVARFQYRPSDSELLNAVMHLPVEVTGVETDPVEVRSFRNLARVETNRVRGGALRVVNDGLVGRANKVLKITDKIGITGWDWLRQVRPSTVESKDAPQFMFMEDVIGGRPIFSFPGRVGGFRLRYGRCRDTGLAALGMHPATMQVLENFIAAGTQLRVEKPGKAGVVLPVNTIEPPIVKLHSGSVTRVETVEQGRELEESIQSILFLGDILVGFGEFLENNKPLVQSGFVEEWWGEYLRVAKESRFLGLEEISKLIGVEEDRIKGFLESPLMIKPTFAEALEISRKLGVPLHPRYTYFWERLSRDDLERLRTKLLSAELTFKGALPIEMRLNVDSELQSLLETLCVPHDVVNGKIVLLVDGSVLHCCLALQDGQKEDISGKDVFEAIEKLSGLKVRRKAGAFIGARMGRPEKAKRREMKPIVHSLFPVGTAGGPRRDLVEAANSRSVVSVEVVRKRCPKCSELTHLNSCRKCGVRTEVQLACPICGRAQTTSSCPTCRVKVVGYDRRAVNVKTLLDEACRNLGQPTVREVVKGVKGLVSDSRIPEPLEKGVIRAKWNLSVFKDGTIRFDATNAVLSHFKPAEIGVPVERLHELGYDTDCTGELLTRGDQLCALYLQDIIIPRSCADYLANVSRFVDELLVKFYGLPAYYKAGSRMDLVGQLAMGLSPHTSVGVLGRIIGFTDLSVCFAHPLWHAAKRRDCDGDEDSISLMLDVLLNFSKAFLPGRIGGLMDAPLLLTLTLNPGEVARQAFNVEVVKTFPVAFFEEAERNTDPKIVSDFIETISHRMETGAELQPLGFTHEVADLNSCNKESVYKKLGSMSEKVHEQLNLAEKIRAVDAAEVAKRLLSTHFMRDLTGNLKAFSTQKLRCTKCNARYRRAPLCGKCTKCGGKIVLTVHKGSIEKYLEVAENLVDRYSIGEYYRQRLKLIRDEIASLFVDTKEKEQMVLGDFA